MTSDQITFLVMWVAIFVAFAAGHAVGRRLEQAKPLERIVFPRTCTLVGVDRMKRSVTIHAYDLGRPLEGEPDTAISAFVLNGRTLFVVTDRQLAQFGGNEGAYRFDADVKALREAGVDVDSLVVFETGEKLL